MDMAARRGCAPRRNEAETRAIEELVAQHISREAAERLVDEVGTDPEKLKAAVWVEKNLPGPR